MNDRVSYDRNCALTNTLEAVYTTNWSAQRKEMRDKCKSKQGRYCLCSHNSKAESKDDLRKEILRFSNSLHKRIKAEIVKNVLSSVHQYLRGRSWLMKTLLTVWHQRIYFYKNQNCGSWLTCLRISSVHSGLWVISAFFR